MRSEFTFDYQNQLNNYINNNNQFIIDNNNDNEIIINNNENNNENNNDNEIIINNNNNENNNDNEVIINNNENNNDNEVIINNHNENNNDNEVIINNNNDKEIIIDNNENQNNNKEIIINNNENKEVIIDNNENQNNNKNKEVIIDNNENQNNNENKEVIIDIFDKNNIIENNKEMLSNPDEKEGNIKLFINNNESPKIHGINDKVFIDIPLRNPSTSAQLVTVIQGSQTGDIIDNNLDKADRLLEMIKESKLKITNQLYIVSTKYDIIYFRFNKISLLILILSVIITFIEAIRLTIVNYDTQYEGSSIKRYISQETVSLIINVLSLSLSTILTILSSIVKFKSYRENMDKLKSIHDSLFNYKNLYDKQRDLIKFHKINNILSNEVYEKLRETIEEYNKEIKDISIFENIRNGDILKFNKIKVDHDIKMQKMASQREIELLRISLSNKKKKEELENGNIKTNCFFN